MTRPPSQSIRVVGLFRSFAWLLAIVLALHVGSRKASAALIGDSAPRTIVVVEDHSEVLCAWHKKGVRGMPLIHIDAHHDFFSPGQPTDHNLSAIKETLESQTCEHLRPRTGFRQHTNALYGIGDFIFPAHELGMVRELWWIIPTRQTLPENELDPFKSWLKKYWEFPDEFMASLTYDGKVFRGEFQGLPVRLVALNDLPTFTEPVLLDIDIDYFTALYDNPVRESMLELLGWFLSSLKSKEIESDFVTIANSVNGVFAPLRFKYLGAWLREWFSNPSALQASPPKSWELQNRIEYLDFMLARNEAIAAAREMAVMVPESPVPYYDLAFMLAARGDLGGTRKAMAEAVRRDASYRRGYISLSMVLFDEGREDQGFEILKNGWDRHPNDLDIGLTYADFLITRGEYQDARDVCEVLIEHHPQVPDPLSALAVALYGLGNTEEADTIARRYRREAPPGARRSEELERLTDARRTAVQKRATD